MLAVFVIAGYFLVPIALIRRPYLLVPIIVYVILVIAIGAHDAQAIYVWVLLLLGAWRLLHKRSFQHVFRPVYNRVRRYWVYARHWRSTMKEYGLDARHIVRNVPRLRTIERGKWHEQILMQLPRGKDIDDVRQVSQGLASAFGHTAVIVSMGEKRGKPNPRRVWLQFPLADPLADEIPPFPFADEIDLRSIPIGRTKTGDVWTIPVLGEHIFLAGSTGRGKSSVFQAIIHGLAPGVKSGLVQLHLCDPKGGMEFGFLRAVCKHFARTHPEAMLAMLEGGVKLMQARTESLMGRARTHVPTTDEPFHLFIIDEIATLLTLLNDKDLKRRAYTALGLLLTQGRAAGISVFAAAQDPRVENIDVRLLFTVRIGLGFDEHGIEYVLFGMEYPEPITKRTRGVAYTAVEGETDELQRGRAAHIQDADIFAMVEWITGKPYDPDYKHPDDPNAADDEGDDEPDEPDEPTPPKPPALRIVELT